MDDTEFHRLASDTITRIEDAIEESGADVDYEVVSDILTIDFDNGSQIIVNKQGAAHQIWVAAKSGGFHFDYDSASGTWISKQTANELFSELSRLISDQAGEQIVLSID
jgi:CyaY protein